MDLVDLAVSEWIAPRNNLWVKLVDKTPSLLYEIIATVQGKNRIVNKTTNYKLG